MKLHTFRILLIGLAGFVVFLGTAQPLGTAIDSKSALLCLTALSLVLVGGLLLKPRQCNGKAEKKWHYWLVTVVLVLIASCTQDLLVPACILMLRVFAYYEQASGYSEIETELRKVQANLEQTIQDRTHELEQANAALRKNEERLRLVLDGSNDGIWDWDIAEGTLYWNDRCFEQLGFVRIPEMTNEFAQELLHPDDKEKVKAQLEAHFERNEPYQVELRMRHSSGVYRTILCRGKTIRDHKQKPVRMAGTHTDITHRKALEDELMSMLARLKETNRLKENFVSTLTHDLRTPLIAQKRVLQSLSGEPEIGSNKRLAALIQGFLENNDDLLRMINQMLETYQLEEKAVQPVFETVNLVRLIQDVCQELQESALSQNISIVPEHAATVLELQIDPFLMKRVLFNLLSNAIENIPRGSQIIVSIQESEEEVRIVVSDNGQGIPEDLRQNLFERYSTGYSTRKKIGSGLGLYICKMIMDLHQGKIEVDSVIGQGTSILLSLPKRQQTSYDQGGKELVCEN